MRSLGAPEQLGVGGHVPRKTLPGPSEACQSSRPLPAAASAMRMDQGGEALRRAPNESVAAGMRMKAICLLSGDQTGSISRSTLGSR